MSRGEAPFFKFEFSNLNVIFLCGIFSVFLFSVVNAAAILDELHLNIQTTDESGNVITGTFDFVFNISTTDDCANVVYSNSTTLATDSRGIISYYLTDANLDYDSQYYLCYYRDGELIETSKIARTPYSFTARNITLSGISIDSNLNLGGYNATASYFFGDGSGLTNLNVSAINLSNYVPFTGAAKNLNLGTHNFTVGSTALFVNANEGKVGIGTATPGSPLDFLSSYGSKINPYNGLNFGIGLQANLLQIFSNSSVSRVGIGYGTPDSFTETLSIKGNSVGIGTTGPSQTLDVNGNVSIQSISILVGGNGDVEVW